MPQKPLLKPGKKIQKKQAANRHGKTPQTKKGKMEKPPKKSAAAAKYREEKELSRAINARNEENLSALAEQKGGKLQMIKAPPVLAPADAKQKLKKSK